MNDVTILAIESSCDDSSAAVMKNGQLLSNIVATQGMHEEYGGVIPELASREHALNIVPVVNQALVKAGISKSDLDAIAFTNGPGLLGSLLVGVSFAKGLGLALNIPLIAVNHMQGHIHAHFIEEPKPSYPFLCLTVSGGHTQIVLISSALDMEVIGSTIDDAAGEAFDKSGKMLGLPYPSGPIIDKMAKEGQIIFPFPKPKLAGLNYSFSGLKTSILYFLQKEMKRDPKFIQTNLADLCASIQDKIVDILLDKLVLASEKTGIREIAIAGGVSANSHLRMKLNEIASTRNWNTYIPKISYCTDNAAMIAMTAHFKYLAGEFEGQDVVPLARMPF